MKKQKNKTMKFVLLGFGFVLALPSVLSLSSLPAFAGSCEEAKSMANDVYSAWDSFQKGRISRSAYDRTYASFKRMKQKCLDSKASGNTRKGRLVVQTVVRPNEIKSIPYKLHGKIYVIQVSGTVGYSPKPEWRGVVGASSNYSADACFLFKASSGTPFDPNELAPDFTILKNTWGHDVCADQRYNPDHVYRSKPFFSKNSHRFWIDNSPYSRSDPTGGFLTVTVYEVSRKE